jgi:hypothetical protein
VGSPLIFLNTSAARPVERAVGKKTITFEASRCVAWSSRRTERVAARELESGTVITDWCTVETEIEVKRQYLVIWRRTVFMGVYLFLCES